MRSPRLRWLAIASVLACLSFPAAQAQRASEDKPVRKGKTASRPAADTASGSDDARERAVDFGERVGGETAEGNFAPLEASIDYDALAGRAIDGLGLTDEESREVKQGLIYGMTQNGGLARQLSHMTLRFLRVKDVGGVPKLIFGTVSPEGAINYLLFDYEVRGDTVRLVDLYPLATGEPVSATMQRMIIPMLSQRNKSFLQRMFDREDTQAIVAGYTTMGEMSALAQQGNWSAVVSAFEGLDPAVRDEKLAMVVALTAHSMLGNVERVKELSAAYEKLFPNDASLPLMTFDSHLASGRYAEALSGLKAVEAMVGGDPYLDTYRAGVYLEEGKLAEALKLARAGAAAVPDVELTHWQLATVAAAAKEHALVADTFRALRSFDYYFVPEVLTDPSYAEFLPTPQAKALFAEERKRMAADGVTLADLGVESP